MLPATCGILSLLHWLGDPPMVTHHENGCFEWQLEVTLASNLPWSVRCFPAEDHVHLSHSAFSPLAFDRMGWRNSVLYVFSSPFLSSHPNHHVSNHTQACFPKSNCLHINTFYMVLQDSRCIEDRTKLGNSNSPDVKKSCVNDDLKLKHKGEGDKQLDD